MTCGWRTVLGILVLALAAVSQAADPPAAEPVDYVQDIKPILSRRCSACHGALKQKNELRLDTAALAIKGGESGPAIVPGKSDESLLIDAVNGANGAAKMPPEGEPLTTDQIAKLRAWIDQGAKAPVEKIPQDPAKHWSYQPPVRPPVPNMQDADWARNPIDAFIAAEHERRGLMASPAASKAVLLRRVFLDLIGLPPTRGEMQAFLADESADAYDKVVDHLLDSPHYGERWGRHWMDVWRYSDWDGYGAEVRESQPHIWRWRDWIIESLNADKPYDQMIVEMLAGDELAPDDPGTVRATGFLVRNWYKFNRNVWIDFSIEHTSKAFLGTTLNCARCHDHMYDPISQQDYYRFRAFFEAHDIRTDRVPGQPDTAKDGLVHVYDANAAAPTFLFVRGDEKNADKEHPLTAGLPAVLAKSELQIDAVALPATAYYPGLRPHVQTEALTQARGEVEKSQIGLRDAMAKVAAAKTKMAEYAAPKSGDPPAPLNEADLANAIKQAEGTRELSEKALATAAAALVWTQARIVADQANYASPPTAIAKDLSLIAGGAERQHTLRLAEQNLLAAEQKLAAARAAPNPAEEKAKKTIADAETALAAATKAREGALEAVGQPLEAYTRFGPIFPPTTTGRRLALARWIADRHNPLTARVAINQLWMRHFAAPLVPTVFDFGLNGKSPTHPALLDWLAVELMEPTTPSVNEEGKDGGSSEFGIRNSELKKTGGAWRMKHVHRLIVTSSAYRQQSSIGAAREANRAIDPDNAGLWRMNVRRMEAEIIRDSTLYVAGKLDNTMGGAELDENSGMTGARRSVYFRNSKEKKMTFLDLFDRPNVVECYRRSESVVPQQALAMANSPLSLAQARLLAKTLADEAGPEPIPESQEKFITIAFEQVLCRPPNAAERDECRTFLLEQAARFADPKSLTQFTTGAASAVPAAADPHQRARENLVHVLLNHNDFLTVR
jgi:mono/diheme cytochrome c family protein